MKYLFVFFFSLLTYGNVQAQYDTIYMAVMPFTASSAKGEAMAKKAQSNALEMLNDNYRIFRVDRDANASNAVAWEREFQKSEDFIDGKIVEQGKSIGAEYVMEGYYDVSLKELTISIYSMADGALKCSVIAAKSNSSKKKRRTGALDLLTMRIIYDTPSKGRTLTDKEIKSNVKKLLRKCFPEKAWAVLRPTKENKSKVKELLIAAGSRMGLKRRNLVEVLVVNVEDVDGVKLERLESIGWGKITEVESENFSILEIETGAKNIKKELTEGKKLRCRRIRKSSNYE